MTQHTLSVPSISCGHCKATIEGGLADVDGVQTVAVDINAKQVAVEFDDAKVALPAIVHTIEELGYDVAS
jgi:copper chaperone